MKTASAMMLGLMLGGIIIAAIWMGVPYSERDWRDGRVRALYDEVVIGEAEANAALRLLSSAKSLVVGIDTANGTSRWLFSAPPRLLQDHWILVVCVSAGKVDGKRIGTGDDLKVVPAGAPAPQGSC